MDENILEDDSVVDAVTAAAAAAVPPLALRAAALVALDDDEDEDSSAKLTSLAPWSLDSESPLKSAPESEVPDTIFDEDDLDEVLDLRSSSETEAKAAVAELEPLPSIDDESESPG